jgi:chemotaxis signal transduction protein
MSVHHIFQQQKTRSQRQDTMASDNQIPLLVFHHGKGRYALAMEYVREIVEPRPIMPYPIEHPGHLGIVNVRSKILPVLTPQGMNRDNQAAMGQANLMILDFDDQTRFCLQVDNIDKVMIDKAEFRAGKTINLRDEPVVLLDESFFATEKDSR